MIRPQTIASHYVSYSDQDFVVLCENILAGVAGSKEYLNPPQSLKVLGESLVHLAESSKLMKTGLKAATTQRNYFRTQNEASFKALSAYATGTTPNRPDLWAAANFPLTKAETTPRAISAFITGLFLVDGPSPHTLMASVDGQANMYAYVWRFCPKGTPPDQLAAGFCYRFCITRDPKTLLEGLESGMSYSIECAAWNNTGPLQWSAPMYRIVQ